MDKYQQFRKSYPNFIYEKFEVTSDNENLIIKQYFEIENLKKFTPTLTIKKSIIKNEDPNIINTLAFHIGLVELISYWKATCSPNVIIKAGYLNKEQISWFKKLYYYGLGEFFFVNNIKNTIHDFMNITIPCKNIISMKTDYHGRGNLIPIGGGKDSVVTLELLKDEYKKNDCFIINPKKANIACAENGGYQNKIISINRTIDKNIIELNQNGFLNGHTPFSSLVAFVSYLVSYLTNKKYIILSNEASASESNIIGTNINHQYSKSFEFENDFNNYTKKYFNLDIKYFSILRPLNEYQIGKIFSHLTSYHKIFKSCNVGSKKNDWSWCCNCAKCLFVYIILSPNMDKEQLINIFGMDLFEKKELLETLKGLIGESSNKPFECVGTYEEVNYALVKTIKKTKHLPYLLQVYKDNYIKEIDPTLEERWNNKNNLDEHFENIVRREFKRYIKK